MQKRKLPAVLLVLALAPGARAQGAAAPGSTASATATPTFSTMVKETKRFTIAHIDKASRTVILKRQNGDTVSVQCGDEVKNFAQLQVGDEVRTTYTESVRIHVEGPGEAGATSEQSTSQAKPGDKAGGSYEEREQVRATIQAIDKTKGTVTLRKADGDSFTVTVDNKANLDKVQVGNVVVITYTVGHAISVAKPQPKKAATKG